MRGKMTTISCPLTLGLLLLAATLVVSACTGGSTSYRSGSGYDPYYYDNRYRTGVYAHHRAYRPGYRSRGYYGGRYR